MGRMSGLSGQQQALECLARAIWRLPSRPLEPIHESIRSVLAGQQVLGIPESVRVS